MMLGSPNEDTPSHSSRESSSTPVTSTPREKLLHASNQPEDKDLPQQAPLGEGAVPSTSRYRVSRTKERPRASQTSLALGKGILKSSPSFQEKEDTSQRPQTTAVAFSQSSLVAPTSPETALRPHCTDSEKSHTPVDVRVAAKLASAERLAIQKPSIGALKADDHYDHQQVTATDDASSQKSEDQQKLPALTATVAGKTWPEGTLVAAMPLNKSKRVSIDPHPTIEDLTPESSSPTPSVERGAMKAPPMVRQSADGGASSVTSNQPVSGTNEQVETTVESSRGPVQVMRRSLAKRRISPGRMRGTRTFVHSEPVVLEMLTDRHPLLSTTLVARRKPRHWQLLVFAVGIVVVSALTAFVSLMVIGRNRVPVVAQASVCSTKDCIEYALHLSLRMNTSANPCHDFHAYVCGRSGSDGRSRSGTTASSTRQHSAEIIRALRHPAFSLSSKKSSTAAYKALTAVHTCMARVDDNSAGRFASFMRERGLPWPQAAESVTKLAGVLDILFDLAVNWRVTLWFDVRVSQLGADGGLVMTLEEPGPVPLYRMEQLSDLDERTYVDIVRTVALFLTEGKTQLTKEAADQLRLDEAAIREVVWSSDDDEHDTWMLTNGTDHGFNVSADEWATLVNKCLAANGISSSHSVPVLAINKLNIQAVARLLSGLPIARLLDAAGWMMAHSYAWIVNPSMDTFTPADNPAASPTVRVSLILCFLAVHESYGITTMMPIFLEKFSVKQQQQVESVLKKTAEALISAVGISSTIDREAKKNATAKIAAHIHRNFWPPEPFFHTEVLDLVYEKFPMGSASFFATWIESRKALRASVTNRYYGSLMLARCRWRSSTVLYLYALNLMLVGLATIFPPSYFLGGSHTMTYSGLGFQFARQLVRTVDERGRHLDFAGRPLASPKHNDTLRECRLSTAKTSTERRAVGDLFALDIAMAAMKEAEAADFVLLQLKSLEHLSPEQTFYVSYCDHFCDEQPRERARSMCNVAVNASDFGDAFGCESRADRARECLFF